MATDIGVGLSTDRNPILAAKQAMERALLNKKRSNIDLAILFSSTDLSTIGLLKTIGNFLGAHVPIMGSSSAAVISNQGVFKHGLVVMLLTLSEDMYFGTAYVNDIIAKTPLNAGIELGEKLLHKFQNRRRNLSLIFSDRSFEEDSNLIYGLQERLGKSFPMMGACVSDNMRFLKTRLYFNQEVFTDSATGMLWGGKVNFGIGIKHGWNPLGKPRRVTRSVGNIVYEIDGESAAKIYEDYFACNISQLQKELKYISVLYPIGIYLSEEEEYLVRNVISIEENGSLVFLGNVKQGSQIRLMIGTKESTLSATKQAILEAKKNIAGKIDFLLVFDSISRYILLRKEAHLEVEIIKDSVEKNTPIIGLYTYGEQAPLGEISYQGQVHFHNQTVAILAIGSQE